MVKSGAKIGLKPAEVWDMTPREFYLYATGYYAERNKRMEWERGSAIVAGYYGAALGRWNPKKPFPSLKSLLEKAFRKRRAQSWQTMLRIVEGINAALGGEDRRKKG